MPIVAECHECGSQQRFADADEGATARCRQCGATIGVSRKASRFVPAQKPKNKKKKRKPEPNPAARLTDFDRKEAVRAGERGARIMLAALLANFAAFTLLALPYLTLLRLSSQTIGVPSFVVPVLGLGSTALLMAAMFVWRRTAVAIERGQVVQIGMILGPSLLAVELGRVFGVRHELLDWLATYGRLVYLTLLVVVLERICVLADRLDLQDLNRRVLSCGVGVIGIAMTQQFVVLTGFFVLAPFMAMLSVAMVILWVVWCVEYFRLLLFAVSLRL